MESKDLTREQLERPSRTLATQCDWYRRLWRRCQDNGMALHDPLVLHLCEAADRVEHFKKLVDQMASRKPRPYRPLKERGKTSGLAYREEPWAAKARQIAEACERERQKPQPPS